MSVNDNTPSPDGVLPEAGASQSASQAASQSGIQPPTEAEKQNEQELLQAVQQMLRLHEQSRSENAIRDLADFSPGLFGPKEAVSVFTNSGFQSSFGALPLEEITSGHCPLIAFTAEGSCFLIQEKRPDGTFIVSHSGNGFLPDTVSQAEIATAFSGYVLIVRKAVEVKVKEKSGNWFWGAFRQSKWLYLQVIVAATLSNFLSLSTSLFIMVVYDRVVPNEAIESLIALTIGVLIALGFDFIMKTLRASFIDRAGKRADLRISRLIFDRLLAMRLDSRTQKSGALAGVVREFDTLRDFFTSATLVAVVDLPFTFFFIFVIWMIAGPLAIVPLAAVPIVLLAGLIVQPFLARLASGSMQSSISKQSVLVETLNGIETVQATGSGRLMRKRFEDASAAQSELGLKNRLLSQFAVNTAASVQQLAQIMVIFYGVFLIQAGTITMGAMIAAVILGGRTLAPLTQLASVLTRANTARQAFKGLNEIMQSGEGDGDEEETERLSRPRLSGDLEFRNVTYTFPGAKMPILQNLSLKIPAGQKVAIAGKMGSGKSTLIRLAAGLIQPTEGSVLLDGVDLRQVNRSDLLRNIGTMLQDTWLFSGTLRENLQMGFYEYDDAHILEIAKVSRVDEFVAQNPRGYDLQLKENGAGLSGGQRQSINLARALLHKPGLLILDEPTSSMDTTTEKAVLSSLKTWLAGRSLLVVTHRNSLFSIVERVLVMDGGKIMVDSTPEQLQASMRQEGR